MSIDRGATPPGQDRGFEHGPQSGNRLLTFFRTQGERFLGREIATGDEFLPVKARLLEPERNAFLRSEDALATQLTIDAIYISAFVLGLEKLRYIAQNDVPGNLIPDIIEAVQEGRDISEETLAQMNEVTAAFEARKPVLRERKITFAGADQLAIMEKAVKILPVATRDVLGDIEISAISVVLAAFYAIDEGFNDNGSQSGAVLFPPSQPPGSGLAGVTADLPRSPRDDSEGAEANPEEAEENLVGSRR